MSTGQTEQSHRFIRNVMSLTSANVLTVVVQGVITVLVNNHLGQDRYGMFQTAMAFATVFLIFAETGVGMRFLFDRSDDKSRIDEHFGAAIVLQAGPYLILAVVTTVLAVVFRYSSLIVLMVAIVSVAALVRTFGELCDKVLTVYQHIHLNAAMRAVRFLLIALGGVAIIAFDRGPVAWALVWLGANLAYGLGTFALSLRYSRPRFDLSMLRPTLAASYIFGLGSIFFAVYEYVDRVLLSKMMPAETADGIVGMYSAAYTLMLILYAIPASLTASIEPIVFAEKDRPERLSRLGNMAVIALGVIGIPLTAGTFLFAHDVRALIFPKFDAPTAVVLSILSLYGLLRFLNFPGGMLMMAANLQKRRVIIQGSAALFNFIANLFLIYRFGMYGAAWATVLTEAVVFALYQANLFRALPAYGVFARFAKPAAATAAMSLFIIAGRWIMSHAGLYGRFSWLALVPPAIALYFYTLHLMRFFADEEKAFMMRFASRVPLLGRYARVDEQS